MFFAMLIAFIPQTSTPTLVGVCACDRVGMEVPK